jgi:hypothetical protein
MEFCKYHFLLKTKYLKKYSIPIQKNICFYIFLFVLFSVFIFFLNPYWEIELLNGTLQTSIFKWQRIYICLKRANELSSDTYFWPFTVAEVGVQLEYKGLMQHFLSSIKYTYFTDC